MPPEDYTIRCIFKQNETQYINEVVPEIQRVTDELMDVRKRLTPFEFVTTMPRPTFDTVKQIVRLSQYLVFPGFFEEKQPASEINVRSGTSQHLSALYSVLYSAIAHSIRQEHMRHQGECANCTELARTIALDVLSKLPELRLTMASDVEATKEGDPAAGDYMDHAGPGCQRHGPLTFVFVRCRRGLHP